jgi:hypothetical protein
MNEVGECVALKKMHNSDEASSLLQRLARDCSACMKRHGFRVKLLKEFFPKV